MLTCRLTLVTPPDSPIPACTHWYVLAEAAYPWGTIKLHPAAEGGLTTTFPHQNINTRGNDALPWRDGDICLDSSVHVLGRHGHDPEPFDADLRLRWRIGRALDWLRAAAHGELALPGEPFELPAFPVARDAPIEIVFQESDETFAHWQTILNRTGLCDFIQTPFKRWAVTAWRTTTRRVQLSLTWGALIGRQTEMRRGAWIRLDRTPAQVPWQIPTT